MGKSQPLVWAQFSDGGRSENPILLRLVCEGRQLCVVISVGVLLRASRAPVLYPPPHHITGAVTQRLLCGSSVWVQVATKKPPDPGP